jgi:hypothetical protein
MNCENHCIKIKIENLCKNNFSRELVLISGCVKNECEQECIELLRLGHESQRTKVFKKNFKFLVKLDENQANVITLRYCSDEAVLVLDHKSIDSSFYDVQPIYIVPKNHDGAFQSIDGGSNSINDALMKIDLLTSLAQCVISSKAYEGEEREEEEAAFVLNKCEIFHSSISVEEAWQLNQFELYDKIAQEIIDKFGTDIADRKKFIGFMSCTKFSGLGENEEYNYVNIQNKTKANPSLGSGFLALLGNGCFYALPKRVDEVTDALCNKTVVDTSALLDDSNYRKTYGGCFSTTLGSLIHEIGHIFDLGHTEKGLMGNDIDHVHRFFLCENFTEIMPKRNVSNCQHSIKNGERNAHANKFTKISRNGSYMEKYHEQKNSDLTFFERNCQIALMNHRWFTQRVAVNSLSFDDNEKTVYSTEPIVLVEIRELECKNSLMKKFWDLTEKRNTTRFRIDYDLIDVSLFVITSGGSMLKKDFVNA